MANRKCETCGAELTREEKRYYGDSCDRCEREETERAGDPDLDHLNIGLADEDDEPTLH